MGNCKYELHKPPGNTHTVNGTITAMRDAHENKNKSSGVIRNLTKVCGSPDKTKAFVLYNSIAVQFCTLTLTKTSSSWATVTLGSLSPIRLPAQSPQTACTFSHIAGDRRKRSQRRKHEDTGIRRKKQFYLHTAMQHWAQMTRS